MKKLYQILLNQQNKSGLNLKRHLYSINKTSNFSFFESLKEFLSSKVNKSLFIDKNLKLEKKYPEKSSQKIVETPIIDKSAKSTVIKSK